MCVVLSVYYIFQGTLKNKCIILHTDGALNHMVIKLNFNFSISIKSCRIIYYLVSL